MTTIATEAVCRHIEAHAPMKPLYWFVEANFSGDKKASAFAFIAGRGRKTTAMVELPRKLVEEQLHTTIERMHDYWRMSALGGVMSGTMGVQGHYANGLAALYLATGQDIACVSESSVGVTRIELRGEALFVPYPAEHHGGHGWRRHVAAQPERGSADHGGGGQRQCAGAGGDRGLAVPGGGDLHHRRAVRRRFRAGAPHLARERS